MSDDFVSWLSSLGSAKPPPYTGPNPDSNDGMCPHGRVRRACEDPGCVRSASEYAEKDADDNEAFALDNARRALRVAEQVRREHELERKEALKRAVGNDELADKFAAKVLDSDELDSIPPPVPLVEGLMNLNTLVRLYGPPKSYKSFVMLDIACCVATGRRFAGMKTRQVKTLYVVAEGAMGTRKRVRAWENEFNERRRATGVQWYPEAVQIGDPEQMSQLVAYVARAGHKFVIFDTQARCTIGHEENSNTEMGVIVAALDALKEVTGACVALVHHSGHAGGKARGATAILGAVDGEYEVKREDQKVTFVVKAQKDLNEVDPIEFNAKSVTVDGVDGVYENSIVMLYEAHQEAETYEAINEHQAMVLGALVNLGALGSSMTDLARDLLGDPGRRNRVGEYVGQLEKKGYAFIKDRRAYPTNKGRRKHSDNGAQERLTAVPEEGDEAPW